MNLPFLSSGLFFYNIQVTGRTSRNKFPLILNSPFSVTFRLENFPFNILIFTFVFVFVNDVFDLKSISSDGSGAAQMTGNIMMCKKRMKLTNVL